ncbi:MAG TPA: aldehyde dehydrogenase EutE [Spirochaetales bacterium]|nr:aldehyde dehydrogenase EutE [Spirochaetales bacterium]
MEINEENIRRLVGEIVRELDLSGSGVSGAGSTIAAGQDRAGIYADLDGALKAAAQSHLELMNMTLEKRREIVQCMRNTICDNLEELARMAVEETGMGRIEDKIAKNRVAALSTPGPEDLEPLAYTNDHGLTLVERAPYGVVGAIAPSTNPTETIINNAIGMISGGNSVVFNSHPAAGGVSAFTIALLNEAIIKCGGPANLICAAANPTLETAQALMKDPRVSLLVVTGGPAVVKAAMSNSKKVIAAGPGNPPCVVDETADLVKAGRDIVNGAGFDNNIVCICEKEILAVASIADKLIAEMEKNGAFLLNSEQTERITGMVIADAGRPGHEGMANKEFVGKDAQVIARAAGIEVPGETRILLCEVERDHPLVWTEQLMPVIPLVRMADCDEAIDFAVECEHGFRHTAVMHSLNIEKLSRMARVMNCSLFVKNGSSYNGLGNGGAGFTSFTIASPTGEGFTRARTFTRERRCALIDYFRIV